MIKLTQTTRTLSSVYDQTSYTSASLSGAYISISIKLCPPVPSNGLTNQYSCSTERSIERIQHPKGCCMELGNWPIKVQSGSTNSKGLRVLFQGSHQGLFPNTHCLRSARIHGLSTVTMGPLHHSIHHPSASQLSCHCDPCVNSSCSRPMSSRSKPCQSHRGTPEEMPAFQSIALPHIESSMLEHSCEKLPCQDAVPNSTQQPCRKTCTWGPSLTCCPLPNKPLQ
mgnify:CR=1 FL=1